MDDPKETAPQEWPDQRMKILIPIWILLIVSTIFLVGRVMYGVMQKRRFMLCDYLLIIATILNITVTSLGKVAVDIGLGRHILDPTVKPNIMRYAYYIWMTQIINIIAVAFLKWSICAWLLILSFSKSYQIIIWFSIVMVTAFNFLAPVLTLLGCSPLEANWNYGYQPRKCWAKGTLQLSYTQGISNIITDVVYMVAPLIYLSRVQLPKRTQIGIRIVFLLGVSATICSIFKTIELKVLTKTSDPTWDGINLSIWSQCELSLGILVASLPPLRKAFDHVLQRILPSTLQLSQNTHIYGHGQSAHGNLRMSTFQSSKAYHSRFRSELPSQNDSESDRAILKENEGQGTGIMKTTQVTVTEAGPSSRIESEDLEKLSHDWPEPK
ncbi:hypothetical protein GQ44DRAFT_742393 [Phaeosphaeriaceae sp. PMI808]|nr:hypothetical protein GQ44DRAFT_742393 [Phaeosphaeriaceae sp. PMI808]